MSLTGENVNGQIRSVAAARQFSAVSFIRPTFPIFAKDIKDCEAYRSEWQQILNRIDRELLDCSVANIMQSHMTPISSCVVHFPELSNVGGCRTYPACRPVAEQWWATLHLISEESKSCTNTVSLNKHLEKKEFSTEEQKRVDDLLTGSRSVIRLVKTLQTLLKTNPLGAAMEKLMGNYLVGFPASAATAAAQTITQNALSDYLKAMDQAADLNDKAAKDAAEQLRQQQLLQNPAPAIVDNPPAPTYLGREALRSGPERLSGPVKVTCNDHDVLILMPGGAVRYAPGSNTYGNPVLRWDYKRAPRGYGADTVWLYAADGGQNYFFAWGAGFCR